MGEGEGEKFLSFSSLPFSVPSFPFSPQTPDTQATSIYTPQKILLGTFRSNVKSRFKDS